MQVASQLFTRFQKYWAKQLRGVRTKRPLKKVLPYFNNIETSQHRKNSQNPYK